MILFTIMLASLFGFCFTILVFLGLFLGVLVSMQYKSSEPTKKTQTKYEDSIYKEDELIDDFPDDNW